ncbi:hypothetical protein [Streptomyces cinereoruber]|uniref:hypothetical protein n=1 Tax=Streptomyces cinereoruber TaxID=67260 RepID=UPI003C2F2965
MEELEKLGMVWSHHDVAWEEGLTAARGWAKEDGHLLERFLRIIRSLVDVCR